MPPEKPRTRGRPSKSDADQAQIRNRILDATAEAYAETGYHGLSVRAILLKAGLSRPTFYRHFSNVEEPARLMIIRAHQGLLDRLTQYIPTEAGIEEKMEMAIELYLEWVDSVGPLLRPFYVELHDPLSPVSELRQNVLARVAELYTKAVEASGRKLQNRLLVDLMLTGVEFLGYRYHLDAAKNAASLEITKDAMLRLVACTMEKPEAWLKLVNQKRPL